MLCNGTLVHSFSVQIRQHTISGGGGYGGAGSTKLDGDGTDGK